MPTPAPRNRLLAALPPDEFARLSPELEQVSIYPHDVVQEEGRPFPYAWFLDTGVASWLAADGEGDRIEVATIGNEGIVGICLFLGLDTAPGMTIAQIAGTAWRIRSATFRALVRPPGPLRDLLGRYAQALMAQIAQTAVCNRVHPINERCARWLLMTHDHVMGDRFSLTHEFLAWMLGVRRASVTVAAKTLTQAGLIRYQRGQIEILDRMGLEEAACPCYGIVRDLFEVRVGTRTG